MSLKIEKNVLLKNYSSYKIGGRAKYFAKVKNKEELLEALNFCQKNKLNFFILAGGTNILFSDEGFEGLIIKMENKKFKFLNDNKIFVEAGCQMEKIVRETTKRGLSGLEWAGGLPGTVGGAIFGNAGAFGGEMKDSVQKVISFSPKEKKEKEYLNKECQFGYRTSIFKKNKEIILSAILSFKKDDPQKLQKLVKEKIEYRKERHPLEYPNAGSVFKNCPVEKIPKKIQEKFKDKIKMDPFPILPTAVLIDAAGLKGLAIGGAKISEKHPNFIVNFKEAKAKDVILLIKKVKETIKKKFGVKLEEEIKMVGFKIC
jgi:UDP-N-acetylmuramate dehydrogenase